MPLLTVVEDYILAILRRGIAEQLDGGTFVATAPDAPGVVASGSDIHESIQDLYRRLEAWIQSSLVNGRPLPLIDGIDLNGDAGQILASYHRRPQEPPRGRRIFTPDEFEAALDDPSHRP